MKRFGEILLGGYALLVVGTLLMFFGPKLFARTLMTPLWALSILLALATFIYVAVRAVTMVRRWFKKSNATMPS